MQHERRLGQWIEAPQPLQQLQLMYDIFSMAKAQSKWLFNLTMDVTNEVQ